MKKTVQYYYFVSQHRGERYFAIIFLDGFPMYGIQVCLNPGTMKRGRAHNFGINRMSYVSIMSNYAFDSDFKLCTKKKYDTAFSKVVDSLKHQNLKLIKEGNKKTFLL